MPVNKNNAFYPKPISLLTGSVTPRLVSADVTLPSTPFDFEGAVSLVAALNIHEFLTTALVGANNDLTFIARKPGNQSVRIAYVDPSANNAVLSVAVSTEDITVSLATGAAGAITSTSAQVKAAIEAHAAANALVVVSHAGSDTGAGVVTALAQTALGGVGGTTPTLDVTLRHGIAGASGNILGVNAAFAQQNAIGSVVKVFTGLANFGEWLFDVGGTSPIFAVSLDLSYRPS